MAVITCLVVSFSGAVVGRGILCSGQQDYIMSLKNYVLYRMENARKWMYLLLKA
jgi:hypothetical protein